MPSVEEPLVIFGARSSSPSRWVAKLTLLSEGDLEFATPSAHDALLTAPASVRKGRWTHVALVHHVTKASSPTVRKCFSLLVSVWARKLIELSDH